MSRPARYLIYAAIAITWVQIALLTSIFFVWILVWGTYNGPITPGLLVVAVLTLPLSISALLSTSLPIFDLEVLPFVTIFIMFVGIDVVTRGIIVLFPLLKKNRR